MNTPRGWQKTTLGQICHPSQYGWTTRASETKGSFRFLRTTDISKGNIDWDAVPYCEELPEDPQRYRLAPGDIVISRAGSIGLSALIGECPPSLFASYLIRFRPYEWLSPKYVAYYLHSPNYWEQVKAHAVGIALQNVNATKLSRVEIPLAPRGEQDRIVAEIEKQFTRLDDAVSALKRVQANFKRYRAAVLKAACEGRLIPTEAELAGKEGRDYDPASELLKRILAERRAKWEADQLQKMLDTGKPPKDEEWKSKFRPPAAPPTPTLPSLPKGWTWATVDQITGLEPNAITDGPFGSNLKTEHYTTRGPRVIRLQNIGDAEFIDAQAHISYQHFKKLRRHSVATGDIVIAALGDPAPRACVVPEIGDAIVKADCIKLTPAEGIIPTYVCFALNSDVVRKRTTERIHGVGRPRLNLTEIKEICLPLPPTVEQRVIVAAVEKQLSVERSSLKNARDMLSRATALRGALLSRAFEGKLVPKNPNDEPATELLKRIAAEKDSTERGRHTKRRDTSSMKKEKEHKRKPLLDVLKTHNNGMSPERLLAAAGHGPDTVDDFYAELKVGIEAGLIIENRVGARTTLRAR